MEDYMGLPEYIWEGMFSVANYLFSAIIIVAFLAKYQSRKRREINIEGNIAVLRVDAYESICDAFSRIQDLITPTLEDNSLAGDIFKTLGIETYHNQYSEIFSSEKQFDDYYDSLQKIGREKQIYLDFAVKKQLQSSIAIFSQLKTFLDVFSDTERTGIFHFSASEYQKKIDWAYQLCGMLMIPDSGRAFGKMEQVISRQMNHFSIRNRSDYILKAGSFLKEKAMIFVSRMIRLLHIDESTYQKMLNLFLTSVDKDMMARMVILTEIMKYVHFSDLCSPAEFFSGNAPVNEEDVNLYNMVFISQSHYTSV